MNEQPRGEIPKGELEHGTLTWHPTSARWIIGGSSDDASAKTVGGCGDSDPHVIDLKTREIWSCMWGP